MPKEFGYISPQKSKEKIRNYILHYYLEYTKMLHKLHKHNKSAFCIFFLMTKKLATFHHKMKKIYFCIQKTLYLYKLIVQILEPLTF